MPRLEDLRYGANFLLRALRPLTIFAHNKAIPKTFTVSAPLLWIKPVAIHLLLVCFLTHSFNVTRLVHGCGMEAVAHARHGKFLK